MIGAVTPDISSTRSVACVTAPSTLQAYGECPCVVSQGEKWSLIISKSKPARSASAECSTSVRGPDCSVISVYPKRTIASPPSCHPQSWRISLSPKDFGQVRGTAAGDAVLDLGATAEAVRQDE